MTNTDAAGVEVPSLTAAAWDAVSAPAALLRPGEDTVRYTVAGPGGSAAPVSFRVRGNRITDPIDPVIDDPTLQPEYTNPNDPDQFICPWDSVSTDPFYWLAGML